jgi:APA family basic amino acid/polyamine antiporter
MGQELEKKYGLATAIAMVVGIVIGSGVFFKADDVLTMTDGNLIIALLAWGLGAFAMIFGALVFSEFAQRIEKSNGVVDYVEEAYGKKYGYLAGWFNGVLYLMPLSAILSWVASLYTLILFGVENPSNSSLTWLLALAYMLIFYGINYYASSLSGKIQVTATVIKLIPLMLVAIVGTISGISTGMTMDNFTTAMKTVGSSSGTLATAVVATAFAYEGWIVALTINGEIKNAKRNLPLALTIGSAVVFLVYVLYFLGINGVLATGDIVVQGDNAVSTTTVQLFGATASTIMTVFVIISCLGTLNGLCMSCMRVPYSLALRGQGPMPRLLVKIDEKTKMPRNSTRFALMLSLTYLVLWYCSLNEVFGRYIALDEIPIVLIYGMYMFLYVYYIRTFKDLNFFKRYLIPVCAMSGASVILYGGMSNPSIGIYLIISLMVLGLGLVFYRAEVDEMLTPAFEEK